MFNDSSTTFGWPIVIYLLLAGIACGSCLSGLFLSSSPNGNSRKLVKPSLWLAALSIGVGSFFLIADLESPKQFYLILTEFNTSSVISWGARLITLFSMICVYAAILYEKGNKKSLGLFLKTLLTILAVGIGIYPALVLNQGIAHTLWDSSWLIPLFLLVGTHSGFSCTQLMANKEWHQHNEYKVRKIDYGFIALQVLLLIFLFRSTSLPEEGKARLFKGEFKYWLWGGLVFIGWLVPLILVQKPAQTRLWVTLRQLSFLWGAFSFRIVIILGGQGA